MPRLHVISDLHLEFGPLQLPPVKADVLVLPGDIDVGVKGILSARALAQGKPVIYVPGNHEFYNNHLQRTCVELRQAAREEGVHLLDNDELVLAGTRFLGTTLWTDFELYGDGETLKRALSTAGRQLADFECIRFGSTGWFLPSHSVILHRTAVAWLRAKLAEPFDGPTVVITHHCPHPKSVAPQFDGDPLTPAFCSDLSATIEEFQPELWIHGHTHASFDYRVGRTRVVCNPRGYTPIELNVEFNPELVVTI